MKRKHRTLLEEPQINLTPLIDVVFVVLIMFIVIAPLLDTERIELAVGVATENQKQQSRLNLAIYVHEDNTIRIDNREISIEELKHYLKSLKDQNQNLRPQLFHDKRAYFGTYQEVKLALENAGFQELDLIIKSGS